MAKDRNDYRTMSNKELFDEAHYGGADIDYKELAIAVTERIYKGHPSGYRHG